jgi:hypothetical protein
VTPAFDDQVLRRMGTDHEPSPVSAPLAGISLPEPLLLGRDRQETTAHDPEVPMEANFSLVQEEILTAKLDNGEPRAFLLEGVTAARIPDFVGKVVVHGAAGSHDKLVKIRGQEALDQGVVSGKLPEGPNLLRRHLVLGVSKMVSGRLLEEALVDLEAIEGRRSIGIFAPEGEMVRPLHLVDPRQIRDFRHDLPTGAFVEMGKHDAFPMPTADGLGLWGPEALQNARIVTETTDEKEPLVALGEPLQVEGHGGLPEKVLTARLAALDARRIGATVSGVADSLHRVRIGKGLMNLGHPLEIAIDRVDREVVSESEPCGLYHAIGGLEGKVDVGPVLLFIEDDGEKGQAPEPSHEGLLQRPGEFHRHRVRTPAREPAEHREGELQATVYHGNETDVLEKDALVPFHLNARLAVVPPHDLPSCSPSASQPRGGDRPPYRLARQG